jgi:hypothetical protein
MTMEQRSARLEHVRLRWFAAAAFALIAAGGCGGKSVSTVHGKVTLDGEPIAAGDIQFLPTGGSSRKAAAPIEQGAYALAPTDALPPGEYRVEIRWPKPTGRKIPSADPGMQADETKEVVPARYNSDSTLKVEIGGGDVEKDFALTK